jgi:hypothetical protein
MSGRTYNKRTVIVSFYPEERFDNKDYLFNWFYFVDFFFFLFSNFCKVIIYLSFLKKRKIEFI